MIISIMIDTLLKYWPVFPAVFAAGIVDAIAGGGGLITLPVYMLVGLPPHEAIGTNKMSSCMGRRPRLTDLPGRAISIIGWRYSQWYSRWQGLIQALISVCSSATDFSKY